MKYKNTSSSSLNDLLRKLSKHFFIWPRINNIHSPREEDRIKTVWVNLPLVQTMPFLWIKC